MRLTLSVGQREFPLICNDDPLESFAGDLSAFSGTYDVAVVGWPDGSGQIFVEEATPLLTLPGLAWTDWGLKGGCSQRHRWRPGGASG